MTNSIRTTSKDFQNALFQYLNLNPHKFDQQGNFNSSPQRRDYTPLILAKHSVKPPANPPAARLPFSLTNLLRKITKRQVEIEKVHSDLRRRAEAGEKFDSDDCNFHFDNMKYRCKRDFKDNPYTPGEYGRCVARAKTLRDYCFRYHEFPADLMEWGEADMDIVKDKSADKQTGSGEPSDDEGQELSTGTPGASAPSNSSRAPFSSTPEQHEVPVLHQTQRSEERNPYIFGPPWGAPTIYRAPLMPPELQREISWNLGMHIPPEQMLQILATILSRGQARAGSIRGGVKLPVIPPVLKDRPIRVLP